MVVDDSRDNLTFLSEMLTCADFKVLPAKNGALALQTLAHITPDLVLLDINMPEMSGIEVCQEIRKQAKFDDMPIVFISGSSISVQNQAVADFGGNGVLQKPFSMQELLSTVNAHLYPQIQ